MRAKVAKPARRRAKQERARDTIAVVLEAAAQVLEREGYARATTNRIAEIAGVSVGTIYQYFSNKDEIFDALIRREIDGMQRILRDAAPDPQEPLADALRSLLRALVRAQPEAPALYRSLEHVPNALFRRRVEEARGSVVAWVRNFLALHRRGLREPAAAAAALAAVIGLGVLAFRLALASAQGRLPSQAADRPHEEEIPLKLPAACFVEALHPGLRCKVGAAVFRSRKREVPCDLGEPRHRELAKLSCFQLLEVPGRRPQLANESQHQLVRRRFAEPTDSDSLQIIEGEA